MQKIYLIRHALPDMPQRMCLGRSDIPLGTPGKLQSILLDEYMKEKPVSAVYCSRLSRAVQTAQAICKTPIAVPGLEEMDAGLWDGRTFPEIREKWPEIYEKRGIDPNFPIPGSEPAAAGQQRFLQAVRRILEEETGDFAIVAHAAVLQSFISYVLGTDVNQCRQYRLDYTGITTVTCENGCFSMVSINELPRVPPTDALCEKLLAEAGAPMEHCREVCRKADMIARELEAAGVPLNLESIHFAALLHDIARAEKNHPAVGERWLNGLGWPETAELVAAHHDPDTEAVCEKNVVFLADKLPLEQRFAASFQKCVTEDAIEAHSRRYQAAVRLKDTINSLCGKEIIL